MYLKDKNSTVEDFSVVQKNAKDIKILWWT